MAGEKVRVAVVGIGGRGTWAAQQLAKHPGYDLVALCDENAGKLEFFKEKAGLAGVASRASIQSCLSDVEFDAVVVTTHDGAHADAAIPALEAGKWVFVEKPLEVTLERRRVEMSELAV